jgi:hypothetical protein
MKLLRARSVIAATTLLSASIAWQARADCTVVKPEIGSLARLDASTARVDRNGVSIVLSVGDAVCAEDIFVAGKAAGRVDFAIGGRQAVPVDSRTQMPTANELSQRFRQRDQEARKPAGSERAGLPVDIPLGFRVAGVEDIAAKVPDSRDRVWLPIEGVDGPTRLQIFAPDDPMPVRSTELAAGVSEITVDFDPRQKGVWKIVLFNERQRIVGGFWVVPDSQFRSVLSKYKVLGLSDEEAALAMACADPESNSLAAYAAYRMRPQSDLPLAIVLGRLQEGGCDGWRIAGGD